MKQDKLFTGRQVMISEEVMTILVSADLTMQDFSEIMQDRLLFPSGPVSILEKKECKQDRIIRETARDWIRS